MMRACGDLHADSLNRFNAAHPRQTQIHQRHIRLMLAKLIDRLPDRPPPRPPPSSRPPHSAARQAPGEPRCGLPQSAHESIPSSPCLSRLFTRRFRRRRAQPHRGSRSLLALSTSSAPPIAAARSRIPVNPKCPAPVCPGTRMACSIQINSPPIVPHFQCDRSSLVLELNPNLARSGVLLHIMDGFLRNPQQFAFSLRRQRTISAEETEFRLQPIVSRSLRNPPQFHRQRRLIRILRAQRPN